MSIISGKASLKPSGNTHNFRYIFYPSGVEPFEINEFIDISKNKPRKNVLGFNNESAINKFGTYDIQFISNEQFFNLKKLDRAEVYYSTKEEPSDEDWHRIFNGVVSSGSIIQSSEYRTEIFSCKLVSEFIKLELRRVSFNFEAKPMTLLEYIAFLFGYSQIVGCNIDIDPSIQSKRISLPAYCSKMTPLTLIKAFCLSNSCFCEFLDAGVFRLLSLDTFLEEMNPKAGAPVITENDILSMDIKIV